MFKYALLCLIFLTATALATPQKETYKAFLIAQSGVRHLEKQALQIADLFSFTQSLSEQQNQQARQQVKAFWSAVSIHLMLSLALDKQSQTQLKKWQQAQQTPIMVQFYALEAQAIKAQFSKSYSQYMLRLRKQPPSNARRKLVQQLLNLSKRTHWLWLVRKSSFDSLEKRYGKAALVLSFSRLQSKLIDFYLYAYRSLSSQQIKQIIKQQQSTEIRTFNALIARTFKAHIEAQIQP